MKLESIKDLKTLKENADSKTERKSELETEDRTKNSGAGMDQWVTTKEAARIMKLSVGRIRQYVQDGRLIPREKTDSDHYFKRADVEALAKEPRERTGRPVGSKTENKSDK